MGLKHKYNIPNILASIVGYRGLPFPGALFPKRAGSDYEAEDFEVGTSPEDRQEYTKTGTQLWRQDWRGRWYFMPVFMQHPDIKAADGSTKLELPHAIISITGQKTIVETPLVGRKGSVKELVNIDDYKITIAAFIQSTDGTYPDEEIARINNLFKINESVELISALTDLILDGNDNVRNQGVIDKVVITNIDFPAVPGIEDGVAVRIECVSDQPFEMIIE